MDTNQGGNTFMDRYLMPVSILLAAVIIAFAFIFGSGISGKNSAGEIPKEQAVDVKNIKTENSPFIGDKDAKTTVAIFADYQCPFCKQFEQTVTPKIIDAYVAGGKTKVVFKDFQFLGEDSQTAAVFGRAVWEASPDKFYDWYKAMFDKQDDEGDQGFGDLASIKTLTSTIPGIDLAKVEKLMTENKAKYEASIAADRAEGASFGINGTPSIIVGTQKLTGMSPAEFFAKISASIDADVK